MSGVTIETSRPAGAVALTRPSRLNALAQKMCNSDKALILRAGNR